MSKLEWKISATATFTIQVGNTPEIHVSCLSRRTARMLIYLDWPRPCIAFVKKMRLGSGFCIVGFQPATGRMVAVKYINHGL